MDMPTRDWQQTVARGFGGRGRAWLAELPDLIETYAQRWHLRLEPPFPNLSYNWVSPAWTDQGQAVVLKLGVPNPELTSEAAALRHYAGRGALRLLQADVEAGVLLLERASPGTPLSHLADDTEATALAAGVMARLWRPPPSPCPFRSVADWAAGLGRLRARYNGGTGPLPAGLVARAEALFAELLASAGPPVVLHGDLHHDNILRADREPWLAMDPKGIVGEREFEVAALLHNPRPKLLQGPQPRQVTERRIAQLCELLGFQRERVISWGLAQAVLSAWWSLEDEGEGWEYAIAVAEILVSLAG